MKYKWQYAHVRYVCVTHISQITVPNNQTNAINDTWEKIEFTSSKMNMSWWTKLYCTLLQNCTLLPCTLRYLTEYCVLMVKCVIWLKHSNRIRQRSEKWYVKCEIKWCDAIWYDMIWYYVIWYNIIWYDLCCGAVRCARQTNIFYDWRVLSCPISFYLLLSYSALSFPNLFCRKEWVSNAR